MALRTDGDELRTRRELKGLTRRDLAGLIGYSPNHVGGVEKGSRTGGPRFLRLCAEALGCEIADITIRDPRRTEQHGSEQARSA